MRIADKLASSIGKGLVAGFAGTAAMTLSSTLEARLRHRAPSSAPARATAKVLGIRSFDNEIAQARFNDLSHWGYGTGLGVVRGLLGAAGHLLGTTGNRDRRLPPHGIRRGDRYRLRVARQRAWRTAFWRGSGMSAGKTRPQPRPLWVRRASRKSTS